MYSVVTDTYEFSRVKGGKSTRFGPRKSKRKTEARTPNQKAINQLRKEISIIDEPRNVNSYIGMVENADQLRFMNMPLLARVLKYIKDFIKDESLGYSTAHASEYIQSIKKKYHKQTDSMSETELELLDMRLQIEFIRYLWYVLRHMQENKSNKTQVTQTPSKAYEENIYY